MVSRGSIVLDGTRPYTPWEYCTGATDEHRDRSGLRHGSRHGEQPSVIRIRRHDLLVLQQRLSARLQGRSRRVPRLRPDAVHAGQRLGGSAASRLTRRTSAVDKSQISDPADSEPRQHSTGHSMEGVDRRETPTWGRWRCAVRRFLDRFAVVATYAAVLATALASSSHGMKW